MPVDTEEWYRWALEWRCVDEPCKACGGAGNRAYGSTATWRGGIGGQAITSDVCDSCWGTGDAHRKGADLRVLMRQQMAWDADQCAQWLARQSGIGLGLFKESAAHIVAALRKESRRRKPPDGVQAFWYARAVEAVAEAIEKLARKD